jgi:hypothetical protein
MSNFSMMIDQLSPQSLPYVTQEEFYEFERTAILYALADVGYGQAFCDYFEIPREGNGIIYNLKNPDLAREWIRNNYLL